MTSEEEFYGPDGRASYFAYRKSYLSKQLATLNDHLDELHHRDFAPRAYVRQACYMKTCLPKDWVRKLPLNVYNQELLLALRVPDRARLDVNMNLHPFGIFA